MLFLTSLANASTRIHFVSVSIFVLDQNKKYPLYETQKMYKKAYDVLSINDEILSKFRKNFNDMNYIQVVVSNSVYGMQKITIGFKNRSKKTYLTHDFFVFKQPNKSSRKIFTSEFLALNEKRLAIVQMAKENYDSSYAEIIQTNYNPQ